MIVDFSSVKVGHRQALILENPIRQPSDGVFAVWTAGKARAP